MSDDARPRLDAVLEAIAVRRAHRAAGGWPARRDLDDWTDLDLAGALADTWASLLQAPTGVDEAPAVVQRARGLAALIEDGIDGDEIAQAVLLSFALTFADGVHAALSQAIAICQHAGGIRIARGPRCGD